LHARTQEKSVLFCLELPASHTYHRYYHDAPSFFLDRRHLVQAPGKPPPSNQKKKEKKRKTTYAVKPLPTSIKEKETHWPEEP